MLSTLLLISTLTSGATTASPAAVSASTAAVSASTGSCCPIVELRQYTLLPERRDVFIPLFEREFIETQEAVGMRVIGQFRDLDDPNRFVWLRGFPDMPQRALSLQAFYGGEVWKAHRDEANANFTDTDNVLLLHASRVASQFDQSRATRAAVGAKDDAHGLLVATVYSFAAPVEPAFVAWFEHDVTRVLHANRIDVAASFASETAPNNFPRLPVRDKDHVFVWFALYNDVQAYERERDALERSKAWSNIADELHGKLLRAPEVLRLAPTPRSLLHRD